VAARPSARTNPTPRARGWLISNPVTRPPARTNWMVYCPLTNASGNTGRATSAGAAAVRSVSVESPASTRYAASSSGLAYVPAYAASAARPSAGATGARHSNASARRFGISQRTR
jgi:hypothetical protein